MTEFEPQLKRKRALEDIPLLDLPNKKLKPQGVEIFTITPDTPRVRTRSMTQSPRTIKLDLPEKENQSPRKSFEFEKDCADYQDLFGKDFSVDKFDFEVKNSPRQPLHQDFVPLVWRGVIVK
jgi:hypothetical protein